MPQVVEAAMEPSLFESRAPSWSPAPGRVGSIRLDSHPGKT